MFRMGTGIGTAVKSRTMSDQLANTVSAPRRRHRAFSRILESLVSGEHDVSTVGKIAAIVANRSLSSLLAFFAALNLIPLPPGTTVVLGIPIVLIACQLILVQRKIWLPRFIAERPVKPETLAKVVDFAMPWTLRIERFLKPRLWPFWRHRGDIFTGIAGLLLGIVVIIPIPLGNGPPAFAVFILGLANSQKDGLWLAFGVLAGLFSVLLAGSIVFGFAYAMTAIF